jgi:hypothetical protein
LTDCPIDFVKIDNYIDICIWKPICPTGYRELGLVASLNKPSVRSIRVINFKYLKEYNKETEVKGRNTSMNEFNFLSNIEIKKLTVDQTKLLISFNKNEKLILPKKQLSDSLDQTDQSVLTSQSDLANQTDLSNQSYLLGQTEESEYSCKQTKVNCDYMSPNNKYWMESESKQSANWKPQKGKNVMLIEPEVTWYSIKKKCYPEHLIETKEVKYPNDLFQNSSETILKKNKKQSKFKLDFNMLASSLLLLIFILVLVRHYLNKKEV